MVSFRIEDLEQKNVAESSKGRFASDGDKQRLV
jgi:hypothetical protein